MPVIDRQRKLRKIGTLRLGYSTPGRSGGKTPKRSNTWILTSPDKANLEKVAEVFGGEVVPFPQGVTDKWGLTTTRTEIPIGITFVEPTQWMEHWDGNTCLVRCNGETICGPRKAVNLIGKPCVCKLKYPDDSDRYEAAKQRKACKIATRINVMILDAPDLGVWMLTSHGEHAADELPTTLELVQSMLRSSGKMYIECMLAIEQRKNVDNQPYPVPVIRLNETMHEIVRRLEAPEQKALEQSQPRQLNEGQQALLESWGELVEDEPVDDDDDPDAVFRVEK